MKATQTGILWSQVQVLVGPPEMKIPTFGLVFFLSVTLSNACEIDNVCRQHKTVSMGMQIDWDLQELLKPNSGYKQQLTH